MRTLRPFFVLPLFLATAGCTVGSSAQARRTDHVVLVTLDGARWQDVFSGLDESILRSAFPRVADVKTLPSYQAFGGGTPVERREKLMPFLWGTLATQHGFIAGDRTASSPVAVANRHWFSYPGYSEILTGQPHDAEIKSNDPIRNPFPSVLEFVRAKRQLTAAQVATFASWSVFSAIVESVPGTTTVNAGLQPYPSKSPDVAPLSIAQFEATPPWDGVRHDAFTFRFAMDYLKQQKPRLLYIAFDETDDLAHDGKYDRVLAMLHQTDEFLRELWTTLQSDVEYRGSTTLIVATDHGRGRTPADWRNHGHDVPGADEIWLGIFSPDTAKRGLRKGPALGQNQIAATIAGLLGVDYREQNRQAGAAIELR